MDRVWAVLPIAACSLFATSPAFSDRSHLGNAGEDDGHRAAGASASDRSDERRAAEASDWLHSLGGRIKHKVRDEFEGLKEKLETYAGRPRHEPQRKAADRGDSIMDLAGERSPAPRAGEAARAGRAGAGDGGDVAAAGAPVGAPGSAEEGKALAEPREPKDSPPPGPGEDEPFGEDEPSAQPVARYATAVPSVGLGRKVEPVVESPPPDASAGGPGGEKGDSAPSPGLVYGGTARLARPGSVSAPSGGGGAASVAPELSGSLSGNAPGRMLADHARAAEARLDSQDPEGAEAEAAAAVQAHPERPEGHILRARALDRLGRYRESEKQSLEALKLKALDSAPLKARAYRELAWARLNRGEYRDAVAEAAKSIELDPADPKARLVRAFAYEQLGARDEMLADLEFAATLEPGYRRYLQLARESRRIFQPGDKDGWRLLDALQEGAAEPAASSRGLPLGPAGLSLLGGAGALAALLVIRRRRAAEPVSAAAETSAVPLVPAAERGSLLAGKYALVRLIGKGRTGEVWEAQDKALQRPAAAKKMALSGPQARESCLREAQALAALHHPNIVDIIEVLDHPDGLYLVFELLSGKSVRQLVSERRVSSLDQARQLLRPVCAALEFAHSRGVLHRDLKASHILLTDEGYVKVIGFSVLRGPAGGGPPAEAPIHRAPEAMSDGATAAADVYSLAVCLYELVTGELPLRGAAARREYVPAVLRVPGLTPALDDLVRRSLDPDPAKRPSDVRAFLTALEALA